MGARKLRNAARAAGFAMVNEDDFAGTPIVEAERVEAPKSSEKLTSEAPRSWFAWPAFTFGGTPKATA